MRKDLSILLIVYLILGTLPVFIHDNLYFMNILIMCLIYAVAASSWDLIMGLAGIFTFAQIALFGIGGYGSAMLTKALGMSAWFGIFAGGAMAGLLSILVALPCLRLKGSYIALVTFAVHMILEPFLKSNIGKAIGTGGPQGLLSIVPFKLGAYSFSNMELVPPFYSAFVLSFLSLLLIYKIINSTWGLAFVAVRDSELFAKSVGIDDFKYKLAVFGISGFLTGMIGGFYAHYVGMMSTRILGLDLFLFLLVMIVLGGLGRFPGAFIGTFITVFLTELLRPLDKYRMLIFGAMVVFLIILVPQGITGLLFPGKGAGPIERISQFFRSKATAGKKA